MEKVRRIPLADLKNTTNNTTNNTMGCITGEQLIVKKNLITVSASSIISTYSTAEPALFNESSSDSSNGIMHSNEREHETKQHSLSPMERSELDYESMLASDYVTAPTALSERDMHEDLITCSPEYAQDVFTYMRHLELRLRPKMHYLQKQRDINKDMRTILIDWLCDVTSEYDLQLETLHLAVSLIDRVLSVMECPRLKLQLVGSTAIMISAKFEEIYPPDLKEFVYITDDTYTTSQVLRMERVLLAQLGFEISAPTSVWFAKKYLKLCRSTAKTAHLTYYLLELALLDAAYLVQRSSELAAAAVCLANVTTGQTPWPLHLESSTGITVRQLYDCACQLLTTLQNSHSSKQKAVYDKYSEIKYSSVALINVPSSLPSPIH